MTDVLLVSLGSTVGLREADAELAASLRRAGATVHVTAAEPQREWRTYALLELAWALAARRAAAAAIAAHRPRAILYSSVTAALLGPAPGAIRFDAPAAGNRPGRHGIWQRPVERRRLAAAPLLVPLSEGGLAEAPRPHADAVVVPVPVAPSGPPAGARHRRDHLRREPAQEGPRPRARRVARRPARGRDAGRGGARRAATRTACGSPARCRRAEYRALLRRARVFVTAPRREDYGSAQLEALADGCALVTTPSPGPYAALPLARALDPRLVTADLASAIRTALDDPAAGYAERAAELLAPWRPEAVDRVVADELLPRLIS